MQIYVCSQICYLQDSRLGKTNPKKYVRNSQRCLMQTWLSQDIGLPRTSKKGKDAQDKTTSLPYFPRTSKTIRELPDFHNDSIKSLNIDDHWCCLHTDQRHATIAQNSPRVRTEINSHQRCFRALQETYNRPCVSRTWLMPLAKQMNYQNSLYIAEGSCRVSRYIYTYHIYVYVYVYACTCIYFWKISRVSCGKYKGTTQSMNNLWNTTWGIYEYPVLLGHAFGFWLHGSKIWNWTQTQEHRQIRCLRNPNPMDDVPDPESDAIPGKRMLILIFLSQAIPRIERVGHHMNIIWYCFSYNYIMLSILHPTPVQQIWDEWNSYGCQYNLSHTL